MYVQAWFGQPMPEKNRECVRTVQHIAKGDYELFRFPNSLTPEENRALSDKWRYKFILRNPDAIWVDCDVELYADLRGLPKGKPFIDYNNGGMVGAIIVGNGCWSAFDRIDSSKKESEAEFGYHTTRYFRFSHLFNTVPDAYFKHYFLTFNALRM